MDSRRRQASALHGGIVLSGRVSLFNSRGPQRTASAQAAHLRPPSGRSHPALKCYQIGQGGALGHLGTSRTHYGDAHIHVRPAPPRRTKDGCVVARWPLANTNRRSGQQSRAEADASKRARKGVSTGRHHGTCNTAPHGAALCRPVLPRARPRGRGMSRDGDSLILEQGGTPPAN